VLIIDEVAKYFPLTCTITCILKYPLKLVIINSPVLELKLYEADAEGRIVEPVESYKLYEFNTQYVGLF
jgi:hypothetical protein